MSEIRYSPAQRQAIDHRGGDVLVSAAAGSGKTSVLSARISALIAEGADIRRMLIVTFTSKAAAEMRSRIRRTLEEAARRQRDPRLAMQAEQADSADICTMHSFAGKLIRENFAQLGLPADVRAVGEEQIRMYKTEAVEQLLEEMYTREDAAFLRLRDRYSGRDDAGIAEQILKVYEYCMSRPEGTEWIVRGGQPRIAVYQQVVHEQTLAALGRLEDALQACIDLEQDWQFVEKQIANNRLDLALAQQLSDAYAQDAEAYSTLLAEAKIPAVARLPKGEVSSPGRETLQELKKKARELLRRLVELHPQKTEQQMRQELPYLQETIQALADAVSLFEQYYTEIKREHRAIDYDDMLRLAYKALQDEPTARAVDARYDYVFIDEYQDTNPLQEALLGCLRPMGGRFMVGDMKQSIYRFRLSDPLIFRSKITAESGVRVIHMNDNYRCGDGIISAVNYFMERLMSSHLGEIEYDAQERLLQGRQLSGRTDILLCEPDADADTAEAAEYEARCIAAQIHGLLREQNADGTPKYQQGDICILLRSLERYGGVYASVLAESGLDTRLSGSEGSFPAAGEMFLNLLRVIDGFTSDIALMSVMKSFMGGFADAELAAIRAGVQAESFGESLLMYAKGEDALAERCRAFLQKIDTYRTWADAMTVEQLLIRLKIREDYEAHLLAMPGGEDKCKIFNELFVRLRDCAAEQDSLHGLLNYVQRLRAMGLLNKTKSESVGAIQIMTIHSAKGLEFPVVFVARMNTPFSTQDKRAPFLLHDRLGISADMVDEQRRIKADSLMHTLALYEQEKEQKSEELRVLYVVMTRAKERLILSGTVKDVDTWIRKLEETKWYMLLEMPNMLAWIIAAAMRLPCMQPWQDGLRTADETLPDIRLQHICGLEATRQTTEQDRTAAEVLMQASQIPEAAFMRYGGQGMPVKVGVSTLLPQDEQSQPIGGWRPQSGGDNGAELGTLIHLYMQHLDFAYTTQAELEAQGQRMLESQILTEAELQRIRPFYGRILRFLQSDIAVRARRAGNIRREIPFSLMLPARELGLGDSGEQVMLQGIIDMVFEENGEYIIVDYKSNMADEQRLQQLAEHYGLQMQLYRMALEKITGKRVAQCCLWFLRQEREFAIY